MVQSAAVEAETTESDPGVKEVECKILEINRRQMISKLRKLGARKIFEGPIHALYFDAPKKQLTRKGEVLRLRRVGDKTELAYKVRGSQKKIRVMNETEVLVSSFSEAKRILESLNYRVIREIKKKRTSFKFKNIRFELDKYPRVPLFLEIETRSEKQMKSILNQLGYSMSQTKPWAAFELLEHYGQL